MNGGGDFRCAQAILDPDERRKRGREASAIDAMTYGALLAIDILTGAGATADRNQAAEARCRAGTDRRTACGTAQPEPGHGALVCA